MRLNIPLSSSRTRLSTRSRRVLWIFIFFVIYLTTAVVLANLWVNRDSLSNFTPDGNVATIHLTPNQKQWARLITDLDNLPLISNRPLTIKNLADLKIKELSIFVLTDGQTAVAIRSSEELPMDLLSSLKINYKNLGKNRWLLSSEVLSSLKSGRTKLNFSSIWPKNIGTITINNETRPIYLNKSGYFFAESWIKKDRSQYLPALPENTVAAAIILKDQDTDLSGFFTQIGLLSDPLNILNALEFWREIKKDDFIILLAKNEENPKKIDFLIQTSINQQTVSKALMIAAAFKNPLIQTTSLPDGSFVKEIVADPNNIVANTVFINGKNTQKFTTADGEILALNQENNSIISSNQNLLEKFVSSEKAKQKTCGLKNNLIFINTNELKNVLLKEDFLKNPLFLQFIIEFKNFALNNGGFTVCN